MNSYRGSRPLSCKVDARLKRVGVGRGRKEPGGGVKAFGVIVRWSKRQVNRGDQREPRWSTKKKKNQELRKKRRRRKKKKKEAGDAMSDPGHLGPQGYSIYNADLAIFSLRGPARKRATKERVQRARWGRTRRTSEKGRGVTRGEQNETSGAPNDRSGLNEREGRWASQR